MSGAAAAGGEDHLEEIDELPGPSAPPADLDLPARLDQQPDAASDTDVDVDVDVDADADADAEPDSGRAGRRRIWALLALDPSTGCATTVVAIAGVEEGSPGKAAISWVPLCAGADSGWRQRLADATVPLADLVDQVDEAGAVAAAVLELHPPAAADLEGAVEMAMDEVLASATSGQD